MEVATFKLISPRRKALNSDQDDREEVIGCDGEDAADDDNGEEVNEHDWDDCSDDHDDGETVSGHDGEDYSDDAEKDSRGRSFLRINDSKPNTAGRSCGFVILDDD